MVQTNQVQLWSWCGLVNVVGRWIDAVLDRLRGEEGVERYPSCLGRLVKLGTSRWVAVMTMVIIIFVMDRAFVMTRIMVVMAMVVTGVMMALVTMVTMATRVVSLPPNCSIARVHLDQRGRDCDKPLLHWGFDDGLDGFGDVRGHGKVVVDVDGVVVVDELLLVVVVRGRAIVEAGRRCFGICCCGCPHVYDNIDGPVTGL